MVVWPARTVVCKMFRIRFMRRLRLWTDGQRVNQASFRDCARIASHSRCRPYVGCPSRAAAMFHSAHQDSTRPVRELSGRVITASMALFTRRYAPAVTILPSPELITTICTEVNISDLGRVDVLDIRLLKPQFKPELTIDGPLVFRLKYIGPRTGLPPQSVMARLSQPSFGLKR